MTRNALLASAVAAFVLLSALVLLNSPQSLGENRSWTVDDDGEADFSNIQEALDASSNGDVILVKSGIYYETLKISKNVSLIAESLEARIIRNDTTSTAVVMEAGNAKIAGFTVEGGKIGIMVGAGTKFEPVNRVVTRNRVVGASDRGIYVYWSNGTIISENVLISNNRGLQTYNSNVTATDNIFENNTYGIYHNPFALDLSTGSVSVFARNIFLNNTVGVYFDWRQAPTELYHNNFIGNAIDVQFLPNAVRVKNVWDLGYPSGGNYWSKYSGADEKNGKNQNEGGSDGVGDISYILDQDNYDNYPLISPISTLALDETPKGIVGVVSNSTVAGLSCSVDQETVSFNVSGSDQTAGFCRVMMSSSIARDLWEDSFEVLLDGQSLSFEKWADPAMICIYITYSHSLHNITIARKTSEPLLASWIVVIGGVGCLLVVGSAIVIRKRKKGPLSNRQTT